MDKRTGRRIKGDRCISKPKYSLDELFDHFYHAKMAEGIKPGTLRNYRLNLKFFKEYLDLCEIGHDIRSVTTDLIREYTVWMLGEKRRFEGHKYKPEA